MKRRSVEDLLKGRRPPVIKVKRVALCDMVVHGREFFALVDSGESTFHRITLVDCQFIGCNLSATQRPDKRSIVRDSEIRNCSIQGGWIGPAIVTDTVIETLRAPYGPISTEGTVFKHVTLKGRIGSLLILDATSTSNHEHEQLEFERANADFYAGVDWALDITTARFASVRIRGIPAALIRRDPDDQIVVRREALQNAMRTGIDLGGWVAELQGMLRWGHPEMVLVAPRAARDYKSLRADLRRLRRAGVAEKH